MKQLQTMIETFFLGRILKIDPNPDVDLNQKLLNFLLGLFSDHTSNFTPTCVQIPPILYFSKILLLSTILRYHVGTLL